MNKDIKKWTDLEIAELSSQVYQEAIKINQTLTAINNEIQRRKEGKPEVKSKDKAQVPPV